MKLEPNMRKTIRAVAIAAALVAGTAVQAADCIEGINPSGTCEVPVGVTTITFEVWGGGGGGAGWFGAGGGGGAYCRKTVMGLIAGSVLTVQSGTGGGGGSGGGGVPSGPGGTGGIPGGGVGGIGGVKGPDGVDVQGSSGAGGGGLSYVTGAGISGVSAAGGGGGGGRSGPGLGPGNGGTSGGVGGAGGRGADGNPDFSDGGGGGGGGGGGITGGAGGLSGTRSTGSGPGATNGTPGANGTSVPGITACMPVRATDLSVSGFNGIVMVGGAAGRPAAGSPGQGGDSELAGQTGRVVMTFSAPPVAATTASIPTLSEWGLILMSSLVAILGIARTRRRG